MQNDDLGNRTKRTVMSFLAEPRVEHEGKEAAGWDREAGTMLGFSLLEVIFRFDPQLIY